MNLIKQQLYVGKSVHWLRPNIPLSYNFGCVLNEEPGFFYPQADSMYSRSPAVSILINYERVLLATGHG